MLVEHAQILAMPSREQAPNVAVASRLAAGTPGRLERPGGIDKLDIRLPREVEFRSEFLEKYADAYSSNKVRPSAHYAGVADMREYGHSAVLHLSCQHGKTGDHKLELIDVSEMGAQRIEHEIATVVEMKPKLLQNLESIRVDFCADLHDVTIGWMHERTRCEYARWAAKFGWIQISEMGQRELQTLYFNKRPNCFRIYNKTAELRAQYQGFRRRWLQARRADQPGLTSCPYPRQTMFTEITDELLSELNAEFVSMSASADFCQLEKLFKKYRREEIELMQRDMPTFQQMYGIPSDFVWTRCERQIGGGRVPLEISSIRRLRVNAPDFNPFEKLVIEARKHESDFTDINRWRANGGRFADWCIGMQVREIARMRGMHWASTFVREQVGKKHFRRQWERIEPFLPEGVTERDGITAQAIYEIYREQVSQQLAA